MTFVVNHWPTGFGFERSTGELKVQNSDFVVVERLPESPIGEGEHLWLKVRKDGQNTAWVARQIAKWAGVKPRDVSYAGLKDRHAVTEQTFSVHLPGKKEPSVHLLHVEGVTVVDHTRHNKKLKTGQLIGNAFEIRIRNVSLPRETIERYWADLTKKGVPNYFGPQRFGQDGNNVSVGARWLSGEDKLPRHQQSIYLSAVRSFLFNELLSARITAENWNVPIKNDFLQFTEGRTGFYAEDISTSEIERVKEGKLSPCASLVGKAKETFEGLDHREADTLQSHAAIIEALVEKGVARQFRKLRVIPETPSLSWEGADPVFKFFLPAGSYATAVLNEMFQFNSSDSVSECNE